jgi:hypothetical protein
MVTQEMKDKGISCKGSGFNCPTCKDKAACVDYIEVTTQGPNQEVLGIQPRLIWDLRRLKDIKEAMDRYYTVGKEIPIAWIEEYNELRRIHAKEI